MIWSTIVDAVRAVVFLASQTCGHSLGGGILVVSFAIRIALLPLTLRMARRMREHQAKLAALAPKLDQLRRRHEGDRAALERATLELHRQHDIGLMPKGSLASLLIQMPIGAALYRAFGTNMGTRVPFLWVTDLARPDAGLALACAALAGVAVAAEPTVSRTAIAINMLITGYLAWRLSASVGLYWVASSGVSAAQAIVLRRPAATARPT
jgi:YidC/Oxa1 family membrane protein insertase